MGTEKHSLAAERIRLVQEQLPWALAANVLITGLLAIVLWTPERQADLVGWGLAQLVLVGVRAVLVWTYWRTAEPERAEPWATLSVLGAAGSGALWGVSAVLFVEPAEPVSLSLTAFVVGGMAAGSLASLSSHLPSFTAFLLTSVTPLAAVLFTTGESVHMGMGCMAMVYCLGLFAIGWRFSRIIGRMLLLSAERERLLSRREEQVRERTAQLELARATAEKANQAKSRFLAAASHDLRQPLQAMMLFSSMLGAFVTDPKGQTVLGQLQRGLESLTGLLNSLLDLSRLDVNVAQPNLEAVPLAQVLGDLAAAYRPVAATKGLGFRLDAPDCGAVLSDKNLLERMIRNLLENAVRYTVRGEIRLECRVLDGRVRIAVHDSGPGIPPDQLERIFEEFHRGDRPDTGDRGLGLGLAIVQRLSTVLHHPVEVESELGRGSTFSIEVPLVLPGARISV